MTYLNLNPILEELARETEGGDVSMAKRNMGCVPKHVLTGAKYAIFSVHSCAKWVHTEEYVKMQMWRNEVSMQANVSIR